MFFAVRSTEKLVGVKFYPWMISARFFGRIVWNVRVSRMAHELIVFKKEGLFAFFE
jgi:hypothetical protein